jgi:hypothetical protein
MQMHLGYISGRPKVLLKQNLMGFGGLWANITNRAGPPPARPCKAASALLPSWGRFFWGNREAVRRGGGLLFSVILQWEITGGSHNTLVVEMKNHLMAFDAPIGNEMSKLTIAEPRAGSPTSRLDTWF